jgi:rare lipoprotein A
MTRGARTSGTGESGAGLRPILPILVLLALPLGLGLIAGCSGSSPRFTASGSGASGSSGGSSGGGSESSSDGGDHEATEEGIASYYADQFHGRTTSNGETFDMNRLTAAHKTLPFNSVVRVTNKNNGKTVVVRINDRGPFIEGRIIDLSLAAAKEIDLIGPGSAPVRLEVLDFGPETKKTPK